MSRPWLVSLAVHAALLAVLLTWSLLSDPAESVVETVSLRIRASRSTHQSAPSIRSSNPSEVPRIGRKHADLPFADAPPTGEDADTAAVGAVREPVSSRRLDLPPPSAAMAPLELPALDPLEGLESGIDGVETMDLDPRNLFTLSWENGGVRDILYLPEISVRHQPNDVERLLDVVFRVTVSPQGAISSAEIVPPGTGNVRIDRYLHGKVLELVFEPRPDDYGAESGVLRLVFREGVQ